MEPLKRRKVDQRLIRALENPIAIRVLELSTREPGRRPSAFKLRTELAGDFGELEVRQVAYQLARLRDAGLLPPRPIVES